MKIAPDAATGKRFADQLVRVYRHRGKAIFLLIHVEIQASPEAAFAKRIFTYSLRILDYFGQPATSVAILCDANSSWRPQQYGFDLPGTTLKFEFSIVKLLDYRNRWAELETSQNPFAWVVMAHLKMQETKRDKLSRKIWKMQLIQGLHESGYNRHDVINLFNFIDWILRLPKQLELDFWQELKAYEEERKVPYITSVEQIGYDRGQEEGARYQARSFILLQLEQKFGTLPEERVNQISALNLDQMGKLAIALLSFTSVSDLATWLNAL